MKKVIGLFVGLFTLVAVSGNAHAQVAGLPYWLWTVPGVSDNGNVKTYLACTNNGTVPATVGVQVFGSNGATLNSPVASQLTLNPNETRLFATTASGPFTADSNLNTGIFQVGSAQIVATVTKRINCSAWLAGLGGLMGSLSIVKKNTQKGQ